MDAKSRFKCFQPWKQRNLNALIFFPAGMFFGNHTLFRMIYFTSAFLMIKSVVEIIINDFVAIHHICLVNITCGCLKAVYILSLFYHNVIGLVWFGLPLIASSLFLTVSVWFFICFQSISLILARLSQARWFDKTRRKV